MIPISGAVRHRRVLPAVALFLLGAFGAPTQAATTNSIPVRISSDQLKYDYENHIAYLRGSVIVRDEPGRVLSADNATVYFGRKSQQPVQQAMSENVAFGNVERIVAVGNVRIVDGEYRVIADKAVWNRQDNKVVLTGGPPLARQAETVYIRAERITYDITTQRLQFSPAPVAEYKLTDEERHRLLR